jgi:hypothetical protein
MSQHQHGLLFQKAAVKRITYIQHSNFKTYFRCARRLAEGGNHTWAAFFDVDEFLILKEHAHVEGFLLETCLSGSFSVNWQVFGTSSRILYIRLFQ